MNGFKLLNPARPQHLEYEVRVCELLIKRLDNFTALKTSNSYTPERPRRIQLKSVRSTGMHLARYTL